MPTKSYDWDVFVSHNRRQKPWVRQFVEQLRRHGLRVFFDDDSVPLGAPLAAAIEKGINRSRHLLFVVTPSSAASDWVALETSLVIHEDPAARNGVLVPILLEKTAASRIPTVIRRLRAVDLTKPQDRTNQYHNLLRHLGLREPFPDPPPWKSGPSLATRSVSDALIVRRALRGPLTDVACLLYKELFADGSFLVCPENMPVLGHTAFLPDAPLPIDQIDAKLAWLENEDVARKESPGDMVRILLDQSPPPPLHDGLLYRFLGVDGGRFRFCRGSYFAFLNSCDYLSLELAKAVADTPFAHEILEQRHAHKYPEVVSFLLKHDDLIPRRVAAGPFAFEARCTAFGTCALVIMKRTNKPAQMILNLRSPALSETPDLLHVIPAGTFQPNMPDDRFHEAEFSFTENLIREFAEELLDAKDLRQPTAEHLTFEGMYSGQGAAFREHVVRGRNYALIYLGTVVDPVNLKPEILTAFMVHEGFLFGLDRRQLATSWESRNLSFYDFTEANLDKLIAEANIVPTGRAHLMLARRHFAYLIAALSRV